MAILPDNRTLSAPLAGISDPVYCSWALRYGAGLVFSGMVCAEGIRRRSAKTLALLDFPENIRPLGIQLFDDDPSAVFEAAQYVEGLGVDLIDINLGCPAKKVFRKGAGVQLMGDPKAAEAVVKAAVSAVSIPVSAKIRTGINDAEAFREVIPRLADAGATFITLHARTRKQALSGSADWSKIAEAVEISPVPIVGNGDVASADGALSMIRETGCAAVMIGRGSLGNPWVFAEVSGALTGGEIPLPPSDEQRLSACARYVAELGDFYGDDRAGKIARKHVGWFTKGMADARKIRAKAYSMDKASEIVEFLSNFQTEKEQHAG
ncbi:MAG TPA: tRNA dihydrouridine synthase DusB [candidate division Zixibacteria bacterium]|nr:tRNA dihydrouridine synthase DusB [candidate division Zixibacteria bacterium]